MLLAMKEAGLKPDEAPQTLGQRVWFQVVPCGPCIFPVRWFSTTCWVAASMTASLSWPRSFVAERAWTNAACGFAPARQD